MNFVPLCGTKPGAMSEHPEPRRFPPPWAVVENAESFVVKDAKRQGAPKFDLGPSEFYGWGQTTKSRCKKEPKQIAWPRKRGL